MLKLKLDADGHVVLQDGKPVWVDDAGKEYAYDANESNSTIARLNREAADARKKGDKAVEDLKAFEGIDPEAAKTAIATVANLDQKKLVDAGEVETIKAEAVKSVHEQYKPVVAERDTLKTQLVDLRLGNAFGGSKWIEDNLLLPTDMVQARFASQVKMDADGKFTFWDGLGNQLFSKKPGSEGTPISDFEEGIEQIIQNYARKDEIVKGTGNSGTGAKHGGGTGSNNNPWKQGPHYNLTRQDEIQAKDPSQASRLKAEAGVA